MSLIDLIAPCLEQTQSDLELGLGQRIPAKFLPTSTCYNKLQQPSQNSIRFMAKGVFIGLIGLAAWETLGLTLKHPKRILFPSLHLHVSQNLLVNDQIRLVKTGMTESGEAHFFFFASFWIHMALLGALNKVPAACRKLLAPKAKGRPSSCSIMVAWTLPVANGLTLCL